MVKTKKDIKWVIYARKSTDDPKKQVRSIDDQLLECKEIAEKYGYKVVDVITEARSAKRANNRPKFNKMLEGLYSGKYEGIISWAPDRLSRNMKEAGEIIDMLDNKILHNLEFASQAFTNDYNGVMALGISFVISKQYSDKLAHDVVRGLQRQLEVGEYIGRFVHGYTNNEYTNYYEPDETVGNNGKTYYEIIRKAFDMRLEGRKLSEITDYINSSGYVRVVKSTGKIQKMNTSKLSTIFKNPIYYGEVNDIETDEVFLLQDVCDFTPMITEDEYIKLQDFKPTGVKKHKHEWPFGGIIKCGDCGNNFASGASSGRSKSYLSYWCVNKECGINREKLGKTKYPSIRANVLIDAFTKALKKITVDEEMYDIYVRAFKEEKQKIRNEYTQAKKGLRRKLNLFEEEVEDLRLKKINNGDKWDEKETITYNNRIKFLDKKINDAKSTLATYENLPETELSMKEFLNRLQMTSKRFPTLTHQGMDKIAQDVFLNLIVKDGKIASLTYKEPFYSLQKVTLFQDGGSGWI